MRGSYARGWRAMARPRSRGGVSGAAAAVHVLGDDVMCFSGPVCTETNSSTYMAAVYSTLNWFFTKATLIRLNPEDQLLRREHRSVLQEMQFLPHVQVCPRMKLCRALLQRGPACSRTPRDPVIGSSHPRTCSQVHAIAGQARDMSQCASGWSCMRWTDSKF